MKARMDCNGRSAFGGTRLSFQKRLSLMHNLDDLKKFSENKGLKPLVLLVNRKPLIPLFAKK
jgi:hypothetical protein